MSRRALVGWATTSTPATTARPASGISNVVRIRTAVVFPAPFGPSRPRIVPSGTLRSSPSRALVEPNDFRNPSASTATSMVKRYRRVTTPVAGISPLIAKPERGAGPSLAGSVVRDVASKCDVSCSAPRAAHRRDAGRPARDRRRAPLGQGGNPAEPHRSTRGERTLLAGNRGL